MSPFALPDRLFAPAPAAARIAWMAAVTYAHRGLHGEGRVENSPSAFRAAIAAGLGIECDVQASADGEAMVFHDWDLDRLTGERGPVRGRIADTLARLTLAGSGDPIWTLPALLGEVQGQVPILIEIKSRRRVPIAPLCLAVRASISDYPGQAAVMSFDPRVVRWFGRRSPGTVRGLVVTEEGTRGPAGEWRRHLALWHSGAQFIAFDVRDLPSRFAARQRARGLPLLTWTVRTPELRQRARLHADAAIAEGAVLG